MTDGEGLTTGYGYDDEGHKTRVREPEGQETTFDYDELGKLTKVRQPRRRRPVTRYEYDAARNPVKQTDANNHAVQMTYDKLNRLDLRTQDPTGLNYVTDHDYDDNGNLTQLKDPKGQLVTSTFDELNRLKTKSYAFAPGDTYRPWRHTTGVNYDYDANGNLTEIFESVASGTDPPVVFQTSRKYDAFNRLEWEISPLPHGGTRKVSYTYWNNGARKTVTDPANQVTSYTYDGQNRLETRHHRRAAPRSTPTGRTTCSRPSPIPTAWSPPTATTRRTASRPSRTRRTRRSSARTPTRTGTTATARRRSRSTAARPRRPRTRTTR